MICFSCSALPTTVDRPGLTVFSLDTGITFTLKSNEHLYPIEPSSLKHYPPLATEIILCHVYPLDQITMTFTNFAIETLRSLTVNEIFMGKIKLATRACFWIDPLVRPVRLAALKRIAYDKPIRKQLILSKLVQSNDNHMQILDRLAGESQLKDLPVGIEDEEKPKEQPEVKIDSQIEEKPKKFIESTESEETKVEFVPIFKPFLNRMGQLIINPVGRSKEFFAKHHQQFRSDFVKPLSSVNEQMSALSTDDPIHHARLNIPVQPPSLPLLNVTTPSEIGPNKMIQIDQDQEEEEEEEEIFEVIFVFL